MKELSSIISIVLFEHLCSIFKNGSTLIEFKNGVKISLTKMLLFRLTRQIPETDLLREATRAE
jgi:hypothetical protein